MSTDLKTTEKKTISERFLHSVIQQVGTDGMDLKFTDSMKMTATAFFVRLDSVLAEAENKRYPQKNELEFAWKNVNMEKLARDVAHYSKMGLNPSMKNFVHPIPYKNGKTAKYDITFMPGYEGLKFIAKKYAFDKFIDGYVQLVHENDIFRPIYKDHSNSVESYVFNVNSPFNRGEIVGGFYYQTYEDPTLNKLRVFTLAEIEKRKPKTASAEFWGGDKTVWKNEKPAGTEKIDGWYKEMLEKTLERACYEKVPKDPAKIDAEFVEFNNEQERIENKNFDMFVDVTAPTIRIEQQKDEVHKVEIKIEPEKQPIEIKSTSEKLASMEFPE